MRTKTLGIILLGILLAIPAGAQLSNPGFETGDFTGWTVVNGVWEVTSYGGNVGYEGTYYAWAQALGDPAGNSYTGVLESETFTINALAINFLGVGHDHSGLNEARIELVRTSDGSVLRTASPPNMDSFSSYSWDVSDLLGVQVKIRGTDASTSGWVGFDAFTFTPVPEPTSIIALSAGLVTLVGLRRRRK